jgi:hypothetical protein
MSNEHRFVGLLVERTFRVGHIVGERDRRVLYDGDSVAGLSQDLVHGLPARAVNETAVDQDDAEHDISS